LNLWDQTTLVSQKRLWLFALSLLMEMIPLLYGSCSSVEEYQREVHISQGCVGANPTMIQVLKQKERNMIQDEIDFNKLHFDGSDIDDQRDTPRLSKQLETIRFLMSDGNWRTLPDIAQITGYGEASISAQLRNMRKARFGSLTVNKRYISNGLYEYQVEL